MEEFCSDIIWRTYRVSPLYNFKIKERELTKLSRFIGTYMETADCKDEIAIYQNRFKVEISVLPRFSDSENDLRTIKIEVFPITDCHTPILIAFLTSYERQILDWERRDTDKDFAVLPLLLVEGKQLFIDSIIDCFMDNYESFVLPFKFSTLDLRWMITMWSCCDGKKAPLLIVYSVPNITSGSIIEFSLDEDTVSKLYHKVHDVNLDEVSDDKVCRFMTALENYFFKQYHINLSAFEIESISTSIATVSSTGAIKMTDPDGIRLILKRLTELAQDLKIGIA